MSGLNGHEHSATRRTDFVVCNQFAFDCGAIVSRVDDAGDEFDGTIGGRRPKQLDRVLGGDGTRRFVSSGFIHQVPRRTPVAMTIEQRPDDAAAQHAFKRFVLAARLPLSDDLVAVSEAADV
jgi:hypothetical protein